MIFQLLDKFTSRHYLLTRGRTEVTERKNGDYGEEERRLRRGRTEVTERKNGGQGEEERRLRRGRTEVTERKNGGQGEEERRSRRERTEVSSWAIQVTLRRNTPYFAIFFTKLFI